MIALQIEGRDRFIERFPSLLSTASAVMQHPEHDQGLRAPRTLQRGSGQPLSLGVVAKLQFGAREQDPIVPIAQLEITLTTMSASLSPTPFLSGAYTQRGGRLGLRCS